MRDTTIKLCLILILPPASVYGQTSGGQASSEIPKRTIYDSNNQAPKLVKTTAPSTDAAKPSSAVGSNNSRVASSRALDTLSSSTEDLNVIRDGNVRRLTTGGCGPEVSARIADLAVRLRALGVSVDGLKASGAGGNASPGSESASLALAGDWFKRPGDTSSAGQGSAAQGKDQKEALLDSVLPSAKSPAATGQDVASLKTELERLLTSCPAAKR